MLPLLYRSTHPILAPGRMQYVGRLTKCVKCNASERINSDYQLSLVIAPTEPFSDDIQDQRFIFAKPNPFDDPQYFEIYNCVYDQIGQLTVTARHIKHCAYNNVILPDIGSGAVTDTPTGHWDTCCTSQNLGYDNFFTFSSDITDTAAMETGYIKADTVGMFLEKMAAAFGGEYHYNNFDIALLANRGTKKNYVLRWNKNIGSPKLTLTTAAKYTHVVAYGDFTAKYTEGGVNHEFPVQLCSNPQNIPNADKTLYRIYMLNATDQFESTEINPFVDSGYNGVKSDLNRMAAYYAQHEADSALPIRENANLTVNFRPALDEMAAIGLGDTVDVMLKGGRTVEAKIMKTVYNVLSERWESIELGQELLKLSDYIAKTR